MSVRPGARRTARIVSSHVPRLTWVPGPAAITSGYARVGLEGLLAGRLRRAGWARVPGAAAGGSRGIRWPWREQRDVRWWPQGIDARRDASGLVLVASWHHKTEGVDTSSRVSFIDLRGRVPRFEHVELVESAGGALKPVAIHAGGLAWSGELLYVADTHGGLRVFDVRDIMRAAAGYVLPQSGAYSAYNRDGEQRMRYSFVSLEHDESGLRLVAGEYSTGSEKARLLRLRFDTPEPGKDAAPSSVEEELHVPGLARMQGVCVVDGTWYITTSNGRRAGGDLWVGTPGHLVRHPAVLPLGPEDLAHELGTGRLWSLSEYPGRRWVYSIDSERWRVTPGA